MKFEQSEHQIQNAILEYCAYLDIYAWRNNAGLISVGEGRSKRFIKMGKAGLPDIIGVLGSRYGRHFGRMIAIEVKRPTGEVSDIQQRTIEELSAFGAYVFVARSVDDVEEALEELKKG